MGYERGFPGLDMNEMIKLIKKDNEEAYKQSEILVKRGKDQLSKRVDQLVKALENRERMYLAFTLALEEYHRGALKVQKVIGYMPIGLVLRAPGFVKGRVFSPREAAVEGLKCRFAGEEMAFTKSTFLVVAEIIRPSGLSLIGLLVDASFLA
jgi:chemotaxis signal transduction protein